MNGRTCAGCNIVVFLLLVFAICFSGCVLYDFTRPPSELTRPVWHLISYRGMDGAQAGVPPGYEVTLAFSPGGTFRGSTECHEYTGTYTVEGELITIKPMNESAVACEVREEAFAQDLTFFGLLNNTTRYSVANQYLVLSYYDEEKLLVFVRKE